MGLTSFSAFQTLLKNGHYIKKIGFQGTTGHVNVFANRMRVARSFRGIQLDGYTDSTTLGYNWSLADFRENRPCEQVFVSNNSNAWLPDAIDHFISIDNWFVAGCHSTASQSDRPKSAKVQL